MVFDQVATRRIPWQDHTALVREQLPAETSLPVAAAVVQRTLASVLPLRVDPSDASALLEDLADSCTAGLTRTDDPELARAFASGLARATHDPDLLLGWLRADEVDGYGARMPLDPALRWSAVRRLAELDAADPALVEAERRRDGSAEGELGSVRAAAARPTRAAKEAAWAAVSAADVTNRRFTALVQGLFAPEQAELVAPYVERYLDQAPVWAARGQAFAQIVGRGFPAVPLAPRLVDALARALRRPDVPSVLRREWADRLDDLR
jgi:aminopeptidase N